MDQMIYNPVDTQHFRWTADWYNFDHKAADVEAKRLRDNFGNLAKSLGKKVKKFTLRNQLISRGGIGSGRPHIELVVNVYGLNILD